MGAWLLPSRAMFHWISASRDGLCAPSSTVRERVQLPDRERRGLDLTADGQGGARVFAQTEDHGELQFGRAGELLRAT